MPSLTRGLGLSAEKVEERNDARSGSRDPATGTAAGPLASHMVTNGLAQPGKIRIEQGTAMGRTSVIQVHGNSVKVHGRGVVVASGKLTL
ncbi:hypothetical protein X735_30670 [Mesorhizobium sp. L2C085B000]|uniref:PhzF family phenazine biosynthesis protein n=1 Tax=unclassified Mesorhizobium TaxID=325217 RepID=UPI0003D0500F|nr:PhzF family phenazine biosynthesis protein [Mesorhizobium sp. L2C085B000]ESZ08028.1 hypothetical protein X735_30670 [Mesorhizobium sp. L2C085B000]